MGGYIPKNPYFKKGHSSKVCHLSGGALFEQNSKSRGPRIPGCLDSGQQCFSKCLSPLRSASFCVLYVLQNQERKHRTYVYVLIVTEVLEDWEDSVNIGESALGLGN